MTGAVWGALLGGGVGCGLVTVVSRVLAQRRPLLAVRVLPYVRDLPQADRPVQPPAQSGAFRALFAPVLVSAAGSLERILGGKASVRRRIERAALPITVQDFRVEQVLWGLAAFGATAGLSLMVAVRAPGRTVPLLVLCGVAFIFGVLLRENRLSSQVVERERRILAEFPTLAELLALAVGAGEGPVSALDRVVRRSRGELSGELAVVLADVRTGTPVTEALDALARRSGLPVVSRFAEGMAVAIERGTPLSGVLHAQAADVREAGRRALIESSARKEIAMMVTSETVSLSNKPTEGDTMTTTSQPEVRYVDDHEMPAAHDWMAIRRAEDGHVFVFVKRSAPPSTLALAMRGHQALVERGADA